MLRPIFWPVIVPSLLFAVGVGSTVSKGQTVGYVGTTGSSTGCHLHFEIHEDGNAVNPTKYI